jgi:hypothetical protein
VLKWSGALAAAGVVGFGLGFGTELLVKYDLSTKPVSLSYKPPLSPSVQQTVNTIIQNRVALHQGETTAYANCIINCGGNNGCILKLRMNNGVLVGVEPDDTLNPGIPREDPVQTLPERLLVGTIRELSRQNYLPYAADRCAWFAQFRTHYLAAGTRYSS